MTQIEELVVLDQPESKTRKIYVYSKDISHARMLIKGTMTIPKGSIYEVEIFHDAEHLIEIKDEIVIIPVSCKLNLRFFTAFKELIEANNLFVIEL
jgi:hypothetical protein